ncbi:MAG TPA: ABC transporter permease, partial [Conexibacter sp.]|nr:ABC transporter permease [Conexibacter sp.]
MNHSTLIQFIVIAISAGTPLVFAATGEILAERSGVMNLGLEGLMLTGAIFAYWTTVATHSTWLGLIAGALASTALATIFAFLAITLRANQIVAGIAIVILGTGISGYLGQAGPALASRSSGGVFTAVFKGGPADWPIVGPILFGHTPLVYLSWLFVAAASWYLFRTRSGLNVRAVGENPATADSSGLDVTRIRYVHVLGGAAAAGIGGACL